MKFISHRNMSLAMSSLLILPAIAFAQPDFMVKVRQWREQMGIPSFSSSSETELKKQNSKNESSQDDLSPNPFDEKQRQIWNQRILELDQQIQVSTDPADQRIMKLSKALFLQELGQEQESLVILKTLASEKTSYLLREYVHFYLGKLYYKLKNRKDAKFEFQQILELSPNTKMQLDSEFMLARIAIEEMNFKGARRALVKLEKRQRRQESYDTILYYLSMVEKAAHNQGPFCKWIKKLYTIYPAYSKIQDWGPHLEQDKFEGSPTRCPVTGEDRRKRIKALQWAGEGVKAYQEIETLRSSVRGDEKFQVDRLEVSYWLHEGDVDKAMKILMPYYEERKNDIGYLNLLANTTARAGEGQAAVGTYYKIYKLSPRGKYGKQALYQAAFLSYQFQDYDGASRKFQEFMKAFPNSGLSKDAQWHLAWIKYLRGDYSGAQKSLSDIGKTSGRRRKKAPVASKDRVIYWTAMSLYRQDRWAEAKPLFESLAKDQSLGFYSIAAGLRLRSIEGKIPKGLTKSKDESKESLSSQKLTRFNAIEAKLPADDLLAFKQGEGLGDTSEESESEESLAHQINKVIEEAGTTNESSGADVADSSSEDSSGDGLIAVDESEGEKASTEGADNNLESRPSFSNPVLVKRFERARELMLMGLNDWAKWDLYDIERKTSNREYLKNLMHEYQLVENFNRSAYIAQTYFGHQRIQHGLEGEKYLWEFAFPRAYSQYVLPTAKNLNIEPSLIWGIMRAESVYKKDVISPVGALGLMQVMPATGIKVAKLMRDKSFNPESLLEPETAIKVGGFYLKRLERKFEGYVPLVAAAYNAGPHRVLSWLSQFGSLDVDEFVEHIPFLETRNYVKKVSSYFYTYSALYSNQKNSLSYLNQPFKISLPERSVAKESWEDDN